MTIIKGCFSDFIKIRRTMLLPLYVLFPAIVSVLFLVYYGRAGYRTIQDARLFFLLLQICYPVFVGIAVPILTNLDTGIHGIQNVLGLAASRKSIYLGKLVFLLFLSAIDMVLYEVCFYVGIQWLLGAFAADFKFYITVFYISMISRLFIYVFHLYIAFRYGSCISVLAGIFGTILAGLLENPIGDRIWEAIPWEWGIRLLKTYFGLLHDSVLGGVVVLSLLTAIVLSLSILWFDRWEGKRIGE